MAKNKKNNPKSKTQPFILGKSKLGEPIYDEIKKNLKKLERQIDRL